MALEIERWQWRELFASEHGPPDGATRLVLFVLALHMNQQGENAFPSQQLIARRAGLSERSVRTHITNAQRQGWIKIYQKPKRGQAWFVHEYVATIPDRLADLCKSKPWEDDPQWERAANPAGRPKGSAKVAEPSPSPSKAPQRPANGAERAANPAQRPANGSATGGKIGSNARQGLPTNQDLNSPCNSGSNSPIQGAAASGRTDGGGKLNEDTDADHEITAKRQVRIARVLQLQPKLSDAAVAKLASVTIQEVQQARQPQ